MIDALRNQMDVEEDSFKEQASTLFFLLATALGNFQREVPNKYVKSVSVQAILNGDGTVSHDISIEYDDFERS